MRSQRKRLSSLFCLDSCFPLPGKLSRRQIVATSYRWQPDLQLPRTSRRRTTTRFVRARCVPSRQFRVPGRYPFWGHHEHCWRLRCYEARRSGTLVPRFETEWYSVCKLSVDFPKGLQLHRPGFVPSYLPSRSEMDSSGHNHRRPRTSVALLDVAVGPVLHHLFHALLSSGTGV